MTVEEALAFLNDKKNQEEEERTRKEIEEAERIVEEAKLKGDPVMALEDGRKLIKEKLKETFQTEDGEIEINKELLTDLGDSYTKLKSSSLNEILNPTIHNPRIHNQRIHNSRIFYPRIFHPGISYPGIPE